MGTLKRRVVGFRKIMQRFADERGSELVEFAFASGIFLMTIFMTLEFGLAVWRYNMVSDLAQEGARWASVRGMDSLTPASAGEVQAFVMTRANGIPVLSVTTTSSAGAGASGACTATVVDPSTLSSGDGICVQVQSSYTPLTGFVPAGVRNLSSTAKMVMAR